MHWDGKNWTIIDIPPSPNHNSYLWGITAVRPTTKRDDDLPLVWAVGESAEGWDASDTLILYWDGSACKQVLNQATLLSLTCSSSQAVSPQSGGRSSLTLK